MSDSAIPTGSLAFIPTVTGYIDAMALPRAGVALRPSGELLILGGGEAFAARLTTDAMETLAGLLLALVEQHRDTAADAAQDALQRVVAASGEARR